MFCLIRFEQSIEKVVKTVRSRFLKPESYFFARCLQIYVYQGCLLIVSELFWEGGRLPPIPLAGPYAVTKRAWLERVNALYLFSVYQLIDGQQNIKNYIK